MKRLKQCIKSNHKRYLQSARCKQLHVSAVPLRSDHLRQMPVPGVTRAFGIASHMLILITQESSLHHVIHLPFQSSRFLISCSRSSCFQLTRTAMCAFLFCTSRGRTNTATKSQRNVGFPFTQWRPS